MIIIRNATKHDVLQRLYWPKIPDWAMYSQFCRFGSIDILWEELNRKDIISFCIEKKIGTKHILIGLLALEFKNNIAALDIMLHPHFLGTGIGGRVLLKVLSHCYRNFNVYGVKGCVSKSNTRMLSLAWKLAGPPIDDSTESFMFFLHAKDFQNSKWNRISCTKTIVFDFET